MKAFSLLLFVAVFAIFITISNHAEEEKKSDKTEEVKEEVIVNYQIIQQGTYSGKTDPVAKVITNQNEWEQLWKEHVSVLVPQPPVPSLDFESEVVVVIFAGEKKTGGYAVVLKSVSGEMDNVVIEYRLSEPEPNSLTLQVITQPYVMFKINKPKGTVQLVKV